STSLIGQVFPVVTVPPHPHCRHAVDLFEDNAPMDPLGAAPPAVASTADQHRLGEGARWDARRGELLRVDIADGRVYRDRVDDDGGLHPVCVYQVPGTVGAVAPIEGDDRWLLASNRSFVHLSPDGSLRELAEVVPEGGRMNDAACDPQGRFWA